MRSARQVAVHPGHRAAHAKGVVLSGSFTPSAGASELTRAAHLAGDPVRVTVRFSNGGANPDANDAAIGDGRGIGVKFYLPDGGTTDIVGLSLPVFFVRTPEEFLEFTLARGGVVREGGGVRGRAPRYGRCGAAHRADPDLRHAATPRSPTTRFMRSS